MSWSELDPAMGAEFAVGALSLALAMGAELVDVQAVARLVEVDVVIVALLAVDVDVPVVVLLVKVDVLIVALLVDVDVAVVVVVIVALKTVEKVPCRFATTRNGLPLILNARKSHPPYVGSSWCSTKVEPSHLKILELVLTLALKVGPGLY